MKEKLLIIGNGHFLNLGFDSLNAMNIVNRFKDKNIFPKMWNKYFKVKSEGDKELAIWNFFIDGSPLNNLTDDNWEYIKKMTQKFKEHMQSFDVDEYDYEEKFGSYVNDLIHDYEQEKINITIFRFIYITTSLIVLSIIFFEIKYSDQYIENMTFNFNDMEVFTLNYISPYKDINSKITTPNFKRLMLHGHISPNIWSTNFFRFLNFHETIEDEDRKTEAKILLAIYDPSRYIESQREIKITFDDGTKKDYISQFNPYYDTIDYFPLFGSSIEQKNKLNFILSIPLSKLSLQKTEDIMNYFKKITSPRDANLIMENMFSYHRLNNSTQDRDTYIYGVNMNNHKDLFKFISSKNIHISYIIGEGEDKEQVEAKIKSLDSRVNPIPAKEMWDQIKSNSTLEKLISDKI